LQKKVEINSLKNSVKKVILVNLTQERKIGYDDQKWKILLHKEVLDTGE
jgi:hypothetical protein